MLCSNWWTAYNLLYSPPPPHTHTHTHTYAHTITCHCRVLRFPSLALASPWMPLSLPFPCMCEEAPFYLCRSQTQPPMPGRLGLILRLCSMWSGNEATLFSVIDLPPSNSSFHPSLPPSYPSFPSFHLSLSPSRQNPFSLLVTLNSSFSATGQLFLDDGESLGTFKNGVYTLLTFQAIQVSECLGRGEGEGEEVESGEPHLYCQETSTTIFVSGLITRPSPDEVWEWDQRGALVCACELVKVAFLLCMSRVFSLALWRARAMRERWVPG